MWFTARALLSKVGITTSTGQKILALRLLGTAKFNHIGGFYFLGPLTIRGMINIGIFVGYKAELLSAFIFTLNRSFLFGIRFSGPAVIRVVLGAKQQIDQPGDGSGFDVVGNLAAAAKKGKRQIGSNQHVDDVAEGAALICLGKQYLMNADVFKGL